MIFRLGSEDSQEAGAVVDSDDGLGITADRRGGQKLEVEEDSLSDCSGWGRWACSMKVSVVQLANSAGCA